MSVNQYELKNIQEKTASHPCYNQGAHQYARMHIPVAPKCNVSCNFCSRKYDCVNESRPGVTSEVLTPEEALEKFKLVKSKINNLTVLGIAGPGDPLANFDEVKKSIELIREESQETTFCLSTNGLMLPFYAKELVELGVSHVTITINAVDSKIGGKIYKWINYLGNNLTGEEAGATLLNNQLSGLKYLTSKGVICKVNIVMIKGINDQHIPDIVKKVKECGAYVTNIMRMIPVEGSVFANLSSVSNAELNEMRKKCQLDLRQMYHCKQCRADAIGILSQDISADFRDKGCESNGCGSKGCGSINKLKEKDIERIENNKEESIKDDKKAYRFAISSKSGINIDQHFGHASEFYIYDYINGEIKFVEKRSIDKYCNGVEECDEHEDKILRIIEKIKECDAVLTFRVGFEPTKKLVEKGIQIFQMYEPINKGIEKAVELLRANANVVFVSKDVKETNL
ncbi:nitrogenase cofactor biosynthesis protein NifB [Clostridium sp. DJ247]|uniref:nitrogenase cofactor biosynthesis protein NifB n=1 Tax=Clostridium sp. DJ247 TaxID=2726188 RepID=UPI00162683EC|nr:nitrogenase cofactor biosynthesis protein NifB [Clostridium sp. DJ247]MBC2580714.1 nitrogenase cofactor biosynthesis protein NifB [Clostridium sp. DJ247]